MARFSVAWNGESNTLTIKKFGAKGTKSNKIVGDVYLNVTGEIPDAAPHPQATAHLRNLALQQGVDDWRLVTVKNATDHEGFDRLEQEPDEEFMRLRDIEEKNRLVAGSSPINDDSVTLKRGEGEEDSRDPSEISKSPLVSEDSTDGALEGPTA